MKLRYVILYVDDVGASMDFFEKAFGLQRLMLHPSGDYGEMATGDTKLAFSSTALMKQLGKSPSKPDPASPAFEIAFEVDDVAGAVARAQKAGAVLKQAPRDEPWGQTTSYVSDPNGYLIEICSPVRAT